MQRGTLLVVSGPYGSGKGTILHGLMEQEKNAVFSVSATTRAPRPGEIAGVHYFIQTRERFQEMIEQDEFLEYADVFGMNQYGTPRAYVEEKLAQGRDVVLDIDVVGALNVKKAMPEAVMVFIIPPSRAELERRLRGRGTEQEEQIQRRLQTAMSEVARAREYEYLVINDDLNEAIEEVCCILKSQRNKISNSLDWLEHEWRNC